MSLTKDLLNELFEYKEGKLYNKVTRNNRAIAGKLAGSLTSKDIYYRVKINGRSYFLHRIIYMMFFGHIPRNKFIDHIDRDKHNNKIENLRLVTTQENAFNTDAKNVYKAPSGKYFVQLSASGKKYCLGTFETKEQALLTRNKAKNKLHKIKA